MKNVKHWVMKALIDFMYIGEILIDQAKLPDLLEVAEALEVILINFSFSTIIRSLFNIVQIIYLFIDKGSYW